MVSQAYIRCFYQLNRTCCRGELLLLLLATCYRDPSNKGQLHSRNNKHSTFLQNKSSEYRMLAHASGQLQPEKWVTFSPRTIVLPPLIIVCKMASSMTAHREHNCLTMSVKGFSRFKTLNLIAITNIVIQPQKRVLDDSISLELQNSDVQTTN